MIERATDIDATYRICNPEQPLAAKDERYVDLTESRGTKQLARSVTRQIRRSEQDTQVKLLFTGHRGSGKTTELLRLQQELEENRFFTIYMDTEELLALGSLNYLDVLVTIAPQVQAGLQKRDLPLSERLLKNISDWFAEHIVEEVKDSERKGSVSTKAKAGSSIPFFGELFAAVTADFKTGSSRRETIRKNLGRELSVFIEKLNLLIGTARQTVQENGFVDLVLIVDGMEKMHYELHEDGHSTHSELFVQHAEQLRAPQCHIIYTVPVSLSYNQNLGADFDEIRVLPMVRTDEAGIRQLIAVIKQRVDTEKVFATPELLVELAQISGGVVRDLMRLVRMATDTDADLISSDEVTYAINTLKKEYDRLIRSSDIEPFRRICKTHRLQGGDKEAGRLLNQRLVLEYQNGDRWADIHPVIQKISWVQEALTEEAEDTDGAERE
jgi:hypothetical protein